MFAIAQFIIQTFIYRINEREKRNKFDKRKVASTMEPSTMKVEINNHCGDRLCN